MHWKSMFAVQKSNVVEPSKGLFLVAIALLGIRGSSLTLRRRSVFHSRSSFKTAC
jgi:hypothetical protein